MVNVGLGSKYACVVFNQQICLQKDLTLSITLTKSWTAALNDILFLKMSACVRKNEKHVVCVKKDLKIVGI